MQRTLDFEHGRLCITKNTISYWHHVMPKLNKLLFVWKWTKNYIFLFTIELKIEPKTSNILFKNYKRSDKIFLVELFHFSWVLRWRKLISIKINYWMKENQLYFIFTIMWKLTVCFRLYYYIYSSTINMTIIHYYFCIT
jgi:hypothetical protein